MGSVCGVMAETMGREVAVQNVELADVIGFSDDTALSPLSSSSSEEELAPPPALPRSNSMMSTLSNASIYSHVSIPFGAKYMILQ